MYFGHLTKRVKSRFGWISPPSDKSVIHSDHEMWTILYGCIVESLTYRFRRILGSFQRVDFVA